MCAKSIWDRTYARWKKKTIEKCVITIATQTTYLRILHCSFSKFSMWLYKIACGYVGCIGWKRCTRNTNQIVTNMLLSNGTSANMRKSTYKITFKSIESSTCSSGSSCSCARCSGVIFTTDASFSRRCRCIFKSYLSLATSFSSSLTCCESSRRCSSRGTWLFSCGSALRDSYLVDQYPPLDHHRLAPLTMLSLICRSVLLCWAASNRCWNCWLVVRASNEKSSELFSSIAKVNKAGIVSHNNALSVRAVFIFRGWLTTFPLPALSSHTPKSIIIT